MDTVVVVIFLITLVVTAIAVNTVQQLFMRLIGANVMFFSGKSKLIVIVVIALILSAAICQNLGFISN